MVYLTFSQDTRASQSEPFRLDLFISFIWNHGREPVNIKNSMELKADNPSEMDYADEQRPP